MAIKYFHQDNEPSNKELLPLLRDFCKSEIKEGRNPYEETYVIYCLTTSRSGDWVILTTLKFSCLVHAESDLGKRLIELINELEGDGNALIIIPTKKGKLGFSIAIEDEIKVFYSFHKEEGNTPPYVWATNNNKKAIDKAIEQKEAYLPISLILTSPETSVNNKPKDSKDFDLQTPSEDASTKKSRERRQKSSLNGSNLS